MNRRWRSVDGDPQPGAVLHQCLKSPRYELSQSLGHRLRELGVDRADGAERELEQRPQVSWCEIEGGDRDGHAEVKRPGQLQVAVVLPTSHGGHRCPAL